MTKETILTIIAIAAILTATVLGAKLIEARHPIIINCSKPIKSTVNPDRGNIWEGK